MDYRAEVVKKSSDSEPPPQKKSKRSEFWVRMGKLFPTDAELKSFQHALEHCQEHPPKALRLNPIRGLTDAIISEHFPALKPLEKTPWCHRSVRIPPHLKAQNFAADPLVGTGSYYIQEPSASEPVEALDPKPGEWVLDLCAAPGGKATQIGEKLLGQGWLVANDPVRPRAERLDTLLARHGIPNLSVYSLAPTSLIEIFPERFDAILVDAPCGGESLFAKRIDHRTDVRDKDVKGNARRQFLILDSSAKMLKPGGRLVYSTCTYSKEENEELLRSFLLNQPDLRLIKEQRRWPHTDGVAGGYWALLKKSGESSLPNPTSFPTPPSTRGLIRTGFLRWNSEEDLYAKLMQDFPKIPVAEIPLTPQLSSKYLDGQSLLLSDFSKNIPELAHGSIGAFTHDGKRLGPFKFVDGRFNNLLPRTAIIS
jgi:16S rRNA C967 or C1407 C5-methylase (RsmB/RsmF family)